MLKPDNQTLLFAIVVVTGLAVLLQTLLILLIFGAIRKAAASLHEEAANLRTSITPVIFDTRDLIANLQGIIVNAQEFLTTTQAFVTRVTPKIESASSDVVEITQRLRQQTAEMQFAALEITDKVRKQSSRVDEMFTHLLDTLDYAGGFVAMVVSKPVRQASGILRSAKAIIETLRTPVTRR
jgi:methyl-accepting chemotaxis protein